jgi:hypothetical protein
VTRRLLVGQAVTALGDGLWFSMWAIFLTRIQGISPSSMGLGVGLGGAIGLLAATPLGVVADRRGARGVLTALTVGRGVIMLGYIWVDSFWTLLVVATFFAATQSSAAGIRVALVHHLVEPDRRIRVLALSRVVQHVAYAVGAGLAAVAIAVGTRSIFVGAVLLNVASFFVTAWLTMLVPATPPIPAELPRRRLQAARHLSFVGIMATTAVLAMCWAMLSSGLPLWVINDTAAPGWTAAAAVVASSLGIALFQVTISERASNLVGAVRATRWSGLALAAACGLFAMATWPVSSGLALLVLGLGMLAHIAGELFYVAARWGLSLKLMTADAAGEYQGIAATTEASIQAIGPALVTLLIIDLHAAGWLVLGSVMLAAAAPAATLTRKALRGRPPTPTSIRPNRSRSTRTP